MGEGFLDEAYGYLAEFFGRDAEEKDRFRAPGSMGQTGYTGLLVETAAVVSDTPDWKEMLNWGENVPEGHPLRRRYPHRYADQVLPEAAVPGITEVLMDVPSAHGRASAAVSSHHRPGARCGGGVLRRAGAGRCRRSHGPSTTRR
jgi:isopenicillin N synthase-like dioxygenase